MLAAIPLWGKLVRGMVKAAWIVSFVVQALWDLPVRLIRVDVFFTPELRMK